jgi:hypothetical protein
LISRSSSGLINKKKEKKSSFGGRKRQSQKNQKIPYFFFTNLRINELPMARNLGGNLNEEIKRGQANAGTRHVNDRINTPCSTLVGQGVFTLLFRIYSSSIITWDFL